MSLLLLLIKDEYECTRRKDNSNKKVTDVHFLASCLAHETEDHKEQDESTEGEVTKRFLWCY